MIEEGVIGRKGKEGNRQETKEREIKETEKEVKGMNRKGKVQERERNRKGGQSEGK